MKKSIAYIFSFGAIFLAKFMPFNLMLGSSGVFFSYISIVAPVAAAFGGMMPLLGLFLSPMFGLQFIVNRIPLLCAVYAFRARSIMISVVLPLLCMALFLVHPIGSQAWPYALYWLIPVMMYIGNITSLWARAFGSTFVAHAVGSVLFLYTKATVPALWYSLIPIVFCERALITGGIVVSYHLVHLVTKKISSFYKKVRTDYV